MNYNILEARIELANGQPVRITVLVEISKNDVRAIFATNKPRPGYTHIPAGATITDRLLQDVAGFGMETVDRDEIFPKWRSKYLAKV